MGWGIAHGFLRQKQIYSLWEKRPKKAHLMLNTTCQSTCFQEQFSCAESAFPGKDNAFHYKNYLQAVLGPGAEEAGAVRASVPKNFPAEWPYCLTWEQQGGKQRAAHGWQEKRKKCGRDLTGRWSQTSSLCGKATLPQSWGGSGEHVANAQVGQVPSSLQHSGSLGVWHSHSLCLCKCPQPQTLLMEENPKATVFWGPLSSTGVSQWAPKEGFISAPGFWHMGFTSALGQQWCLSPGCCRDAFPSAPT